MLVGLSLFHAIKVQLEEKEVLGKRRVVNDIKKKGHRT